MAVNREKRLADAASWLIATRNILQNQAHLLRLWADNIERFAHFYDRETENFEQELRRQHAAE